VLKQAQLGVARIVGASALLVDESQDLNAAQVSWLSAQALYGLDVFFVGDAAQTIYSFRGAKARYIAQLANAHDAQLTVSFRFGPKIAAAANALLLSKRFSAQTDPDPNHALWWPYYVTGAARAPGRVLECDLVAARAWGGERGPITVIARTNVGLLNMVLPVLAGGADGSAPPRIAVLGEGDNAGAKLWRRVLAEVAGFCAVFDARASSLPLQPWKSEADEARADGPAALPAKHRHQHFALHRGIQTMRPGAKEDGPRRHRRRRGFVSRLHKHLGRHTVVGRPHRVRRDLEGLHKIRADPENDNRRHEEEFDVFHERALGVDSPTGAAQHFLECFNFKSQLFGPDLVLEQRPERRDMGLQFAH
jgi:hypothetical protein